MSKLELPWFAVADGTGLSLGGADAGTRPLDVATDEDWAESCEHARRAISTGLARVEPGRTWEESIAGWAAYYLRRGVPDRKPGAPRAAVAMGRTADEDAWQEQRERWIEIVHEVAARGSEHHEQGYQQLGAPAPVFYTRVEAQALAAAKILPEGLAPAWRATGLVNTAGGMVPLADVPRSERG